MENSQCVCPSVAWIEYIKSASGFFICLTVLFLFFYLKRIWQKAAEFFYNVSDTGVSDKYYDVLFSDIERCLIQAKIQNASSIIESLKENKAVKLNESIEEIGYTPNMKNASTVLITPYVIVTGKAGETRKLSLAREIDRDYVPDEVRALIYSSFQKSNNVLLYKKDNCHE